MIALIYKHQNGIEIINGIDLHDCLNAIGATAFVNQHRLAPITDPDQIITIYNNQNRSSGEAIYKPRRFATDTLTNKINNLIEDTTAAFGQPHEISSEQYGHIEELLAHLAATDPHNR